MGGRGEHNASEPPAPRPAFAHGVGAPPQRARDVAAAGVVVAYRGELNEQHVADGVHREFRRISLWQQVLCAAAMGVGIVASVTCQSLPVLRLAFLNYSLWSLVEWGYHNKVMHAKPKSWGRRYLRHHNLLHINHHKDTRPDMTMQETYDRDAVYFHTRVTLYTPVLGCLVLSALIAATGAAIPYWWTIVSPTVIAIIHGVLWNTLHADSHGLELDLTIHGPPRLTSLPRDNPYSHWVVRNHSLHHIMRGIGNYNIIFPGWDHVLGTYHYATHPESMVPNQLSAAVA